MRETPGDNSSHTNMATPGYFQQLSIPVHTESIVTLPLAHCLNTSAAEHIVQRYSFYSLHTVTHLTLKARSQQSTLLYPLHYGVFGASTLTTPYDLLVDQPSNPFCLWSL